VPTFSILSGEVLNRIACRYGPGDIYLYRFGLIPGNRIEIYGRVELRSGREMQTWLWGLAEGYLDRCWVNARDVQLNGELSSLEMVYPGKAEIPLTFNWPAPQNVRALRRGNSVSIYWDFFDLPLGERESEQSPRYVLELWLCQNGEVAFTPIGVMESSLIVIDEPGCTEPSHGRIYLAEVHGYVGPVEIPWPIQGTPTP
jgi:hypothetical protein